MDRNSDTDTKSRLPKRPKWRQYFTLKSIGGFVGFVAILSLLWQVYIDTRSEDALVHIVSARLQEDKIYELAQFDENLLDHLGITRFYKNELFDTVIQRTFINPDVIHTPTIRDVTVLIIKNRDKGSYELKLSLYDDEITYTNFTPNDALAVCIGVSYYDGKEISITNDLLNISLDGSQRFLELPKSYEIVDSKFPNQIIFGYPE